MEIDQSYFAKFLGGTLVEYTERHEFNREWGRVRIMGVCFEGENGIRLHTDGEARFGTDYVSSERMREYEGVLYIGRTPYLPFTTACFAIAPPGISIPRPEDRTIDPQDLFKSS